MTDNRVDFSDWFEKHARHNDEMRHLREKGAQERAHHDEMMRLINEQKKLIEKFKATRNAYDRLEAQFDSFVDIVKEHLHEMSISKDEINARINAAGDSAKLSYPECP